MRVVNYLFLFLMMASSAVYGAPLEGKHDAVARALAYTGLSAVSDTTKLDPEQCVVAATMADSTTPFLADEINGKTAWLVTFDSVYFDLPDRAPQILENQAPRLVRVFLDSTSGVLFRIESIAIGEQKMVDPEPLADEAVRSMKGEEYTGFPEEVPPTTFLQAIAAAVPSQPLRSVEVVAHYVMHSSGGDSDAIPVWCITGRGGPGIELFAIPPGSERPPDFGKDRIRSVVDARTGELLFFTNRPHTDQKGER